VSALDDALILFDFTVSSAVSAWAPVDDRVMGGVSRSRMRHDTAGYAVFEGCVSLERGGGFASVRCAPGARGRPGARACVLEVRGAGPVFKLNLRTDDGFDGPTWQARFAPAVEWRTVRLPLAGFVATFRGRALHGAPALDPARICQVGLVIADRQAGPFALDVRRIALE
jgi:NADH dehydrogenase [ubiquinone] 1 alpha subcomplex assembly factor 1